MYALKPAEQTKRCKSIRLLPNCAYELSLVLASAGGYVQQSNVSRIRLGFVILEATGSGDLCRPNRHRQVRLGDSLLLASEGASKGRKARTEGAPKNTAPCKWQDVETSGRHHTYTRQWLQEPGISVTALAMKDLEPAYHHCFRTYGYKDGLASSAGAAELMTELSELGGIYDVAHAQGRHLWVVTTSVGWEVRDKGLKLDELLSKLMRMLGMEDEEGIRKLTAGCLIEGTETKRGCRPFALVGMTPKTSGTVAFATSEWDKSQGRFKEAVVRVAMSYDEDQWFATFKWAGSHWKVWSSPNVTVPGGDGEGQEEGEGEGDRDLRRIRTSKSLKLKRNHILIEELEEMCKHIADKADAEMPIDLTSFLKIIFDMVDGYVNDNSGAKAGRGGGGGSGEEADPLMTRQDAMRLAEEADVVCRRMDSVSDSFEIEERNIAYGLHDPSMPSSGAFVEALEAFAAQLEAVLSRLVGNFDISKQLVESGVVEFLCTRMRTYQAAQNNQKVCKSLWLLCLLLGEGISTRKTPRQYGGSLCGTLLEYANNMQPRILPELCRRGGVHTAIDVFIQCWKHAVQLPDYPMLHRMAIMMLQVAEIKPELAMLTLAYDSDKGRAECCVRALATRLPIKEKRAVTHGRVVLGKVHRMENPFEPEKAQSWGPGWASSGELLAIQDLQDCKDAEGCILMIPPAKDWKTHAAIVQQACRLVHFAHLAGASAVVFVWPGPLIQQIHPNLNFAHHSSVSSWIVPCTEDVQDVIDALEANDGGRGPPKEVRCAFDVVKSRFDDVVAFDFVRESASLALAHSIALQFQTCLRETVLCIPKEIRPAGRRVRILCLDGGGVRGMAIISMLNVISDEIKRSLKKGEHFEGLASYFDLIVGTSAGGLIAMGLGGGMTLDGIREFFGKSIHEVFNTSDSYYEQLQRGPGASAARRLEEIINVEWPERSARSSADSSFFSTRFHIEDGNLGSKPGVCVLTSLVSREPARSCMLKNYNTNDDLLHFMPSDHRANVLACSRATSAAPYYLEEMMCYKDLCTGKFLSSMADGKGKDPGAFYMDPVVGTYRFIDGAISVNNPTTTAILEAKSIYSDNYGLLVVSLGTGTGLPRCPIKTYPSGLGVVLQNLISATANVALADAQARSMLRASDRFFRFTPAGDVFNCDIGTKDKDTVALLEEETMNYMKSEQAQDKLKSMVARLLEE